MSKKLFILTEQGLVTGIIVPIDILTREGKELLNGITRYEQCQFEPDTHFSVEDTHLISFRGLKRYLVICTFTGDSRESQTFVIMAMDDILKQEHRRGMISTRQPAIHSYPYYIGTLEQAFDLFGVRENALWPV